MNRKKLGSFCIDNIVWVLLVVSIIAMGIIKPVFFTPKILANIFTQTTVLGIFTVAMAMAILLGDINLSIIGTAAFSAAIATSLMCYQGLHWILAAILCMVIGFLVGLLNGFIIAKIKAVALIETLAMNMVLSGAVLAITQGKTTSNYPDAYKFIGQGSVAGLPVLPIVLFIVYILFYIVWKKTVYGRSLFAVGGNPNSAYAAGINVDRIKMTSFAVGGLLSGLAGYLLSSYMGAVTTSFGDAYEMQSIAAAVIGGVSLSGGRGCQTANYNRVQQQIKIPSDTYQTARSCL
ncbi:MAG: ABC transporter permease [Lachnospiraceae bacterium]|nr:ABC transporter permease [Lachnospiraceae bacterium]